jgi:dCTP deaminase
MNLRPTKMTTLNDRAIKGLGAKLINPYREELVQPASIDLLLGEYFRVMEPHDEICIDLNDPVDITTMVHRPDKFVIHPGEFVLGVTDEIVNIPDDMVARVEGKSSLGRLGLLVHVTAGFVDPGFNGAITLEFCNLAPIPIILRPGKAICQLSFSWLNAPAHNPYNGKYQGARSVQASRYGKEST